MPKDHAEGPSQIERLSWIVSLSLFPSPTHLSPSSQPTKWKTLENHPEENLNGRWFHDFMGDMQPPWDATVSR